VWMQMVHLLMADLLWIALVLLAASALATPRVSASS
jgi:cytochrome c oxidase assembly protein subunit 15